MKWLDKLERRYGNIGIRNLMLYIAGCNAAVLLIYIATQATVGSNFVSRLELDPQLVMSGEVWRLITFAFIPPSLSPIFALFVIYFYYLIGSTLENEWGVLKFNVYYFIGIIGTIIGTFISGEVGTSYYLNLSLFLAFAFIYPNYQILFLFIFPIKIKYLAWVDAAYLGYSFIMGGTSDRILVVVAILNFLLFFGRDIILHIRSGRRAHYNHRRFEANIPRDTAIHMCEVCKRTEKDDKDLEFRYCVDCEGDHEYCMEHLENHVHIKNGERKPQ